MAGKAKSESKSEDVGQAEVSDAFEQAQERGFFGNEVDPTPNENYSLDGVTSGAPTPETDAKAAAEAAVVSPGPFPSESGKGA